MDSHMEKVFKEIYDNDDNDRRIMESKVKHSSMSTNPKFASSSTDKELTDDDNTEHFDSEESALPVESALPEGSAEPEPNHDFEDALKSFEDLVKTASSLSHSPSSNANHEHVKRAVDDYQRLPDEHIMFHIEEAYGMIRKASVAVEEDNYSAFKLLMKARSIMKLLVSQIKSRSMAKVVSKVKAATKRKQKRSVSDDGEGLNFKSKMVSRGFNSQEYDWLANEFHLSKQEVDEVKNLSEEEFYLFSRRLQEETDMSESDYSVDDLLQVFKSARQLVPAELEAAAHGIVHVGRHLGGRARVAVDPVVSLVRDTVIPGAERLVDQAVETVPADVKDWVGEGGKIAARRVEMVVEYVEPKLTELSHTISEVQSELAESAEEAYVRIAPKVLPL